MVYKGVKTNRESNCWNRKKNVKEKNKLSNRVREKNVDS